MILIFAYTGLYGKTPTLERYHVKGRITDSTGNAVAYAHIMFGTGISYSILYNTLFRFSG